MVSAQVERIARRMACGAHGKPGRWMSGCQRSVQATHAGNQCRNSDVICMASASWSAPRWNFMPDRWPARRTARLDGGCAGTSPPSTPHTPGTSAETATRSAHHPIHDQLLGDPHMPHCQTREAFEGRAELLSACPGASNLSGHACWEPAQEQRRDFTPPDP